MKISTSVLTKGVKWKKAWLKEDSNAYATLVAVVKNKSLLSRKAFLKSFPNTANITGFHLFCNKYCSKTLHYSYGMVAKLQLTILFYNSDKGSYRAQRENGRDCFKQVYSKVAESWCVKKVLRHYSCDYNRRLSTNNWPVLSEPSWNNKVSTFF